MAAGVSSGDPAVLAAAAGSAVLGTEFLLIGRASVIAFGLWVLGFILCFVLTFRVLWKLATVVNQAPTGSWLLLVVAPQSLAALAAQLSAVRPGLGFFEAGLVLFFTGAALYLMISPLIFYRLTVMPLAPRDFSPTFWISTGAASVSCLAATALITTAEAAPVFPGFLPVLRPLALLFWGTASWWMPLIIILQVWRHRRGRAALRYERDWWSAVFPIGMYAACSQDLGRVLGLGALIDISRVFLAAALAVWLVTLWAMGRGLREPAS